MEAERQKSVKRRGRREQRFIQVVGGQSVFDLFYLRTDRRKRVGKNRRGLLWYIKSGRGQSVVRR